MTHRGCSEVPAVPIHRVLELLERDEDEHRRRLQPRPRGQPALEHEHRALVAHRGADHLQGRLALGAGGGHDSALLCGRGRREEREGGGEKEKGRRGGEPWCGLMKMKTLNLIYVTW